jgi:hypothetical protein
MIKELISDASDVFQRAVNALTNTPLMTSAVYKCEYNSGMVTQISNFWLDAYPTTRTETSYKISERATESTHLILPNHKSTENRRSVRMDENNNPILYTKDEVLAEFKSFEERMDVLCSHPKSRYGMNYSKKSNGNRALPAENFGPAIW